MKLRLSSFNNAKTQNTWVLKVSVVDRRAKDSNMGFSRTPRPDWHLSYLHTSHWPELTAKEAGKSGKTHVYLESICYLYCMFCKYKSV